MSDQARHQLSNPLGGFGVESLLDDEYDGNWRLLPTLSFEPSALDSWPAEPVVASPPSQTQKGLKYRDAEDLWLREKPLHTLSLCVLRASVLIIFLPKKQKLVV